MELAKIEQLVEKYENAETTLQEEATLRNYFLSGNVAPHLEEYQMMFTYFRASQDETYNKTFEFNTQKKRNYKWLSIAASIVLLFSIYMGKTSYDQYLVKKEAQETYAKVEKALKMLSTNLNKGNEAFNHLYAYENSVNKIFRTK